MTHSDLATDNTMTASISRDAPKQFMRLVRRCKRRLKTGTEKKECVSIEMKPWPDYAAKCSEFDKASVP